MATAPEKNKTARQLKARYAVRPEIRLYLDDKASGAACAPVLEQFNYSPEQVIRPGGVHAAINDMSQGAKPQILFVDLGNQTDVQPDVQKLAQACPPEMVVIALGIHNDVQLFRQLINTGIQDYLVKPIQPEVFGEALEDALATLEAEETAVQPDDLKRLVVVTGVRGGIGASTLAANLAWLYSRGLSDQSAKNQKETKGQKQAKKTSTVLLDMDILFGTGAVQFDVEPGNGLLDALVNPHRLDSLFVERAAIRVADNFSVLAAEAPLAALENHRAEAPEALVRAMYEAFSTIIVDQPRATIAQNKTVLSRASDIVVVTDYSLAGARDCIRLCGFLSEAALGATIHVVASKAGIALDEVESKDFISSIEKKIAATLPHDPKTCLAAAQKGKTVAEVQPTTKLARAMVALKDKIDPPDAIHEQPNLLARWFGSQNKKKQPQ